MYADHFEVLKPPWKLNLAWACGTDLETMFSGIYFFCLLCKVQGEWFAYRILLLSREGIELFFFQVYLLWNKEILEVSAREKIPASCLKVKHTVVIVLPLHLKVADG